MLSDRIIKKTVLFKYLFLLSTVFVLLSFQSDIRRISLLMETKILSQGKYVSSAAEIFYKFREGEMIVRYQKPFEYIVISNAKGEAKVYNPKTNEVSVQQGFMYETEKSLFYYFFSNRTTDLGLKDLGFMLDNTRFEDGMIITTWKPGLSIGEQVSKVELVHEKYLPIYLGYYDKKGQLTKKIFYYDYFSSGSIRLPTKVTEFSYLPDGDSVISRTVYGNFKFNENAQSSYFDFKIPANAKIVD